jgi:hypothetical protein
MEEVAVDELLTMVVMVLQTLHNSRWKRERKKMEALWVVSIDKRD